MRRCVPERKHGVSIALTLAIGMGCWLVAYLGASAGWGIRYQALGSQVQGRT
jgi:hypothetical protein